jgi:hypothetical protein
MTEFSDRGKFARDLALQGQVKVALIRSAVDVMAEDVKIDFHRQRRAFANQVLRSPDGFVTQFSLAVAAQPGVKIDSTASDDDVQFTVNSLFNAFAVPDDSQPQPASVAKPVA